MKQVLMNVIVAVVAVCIYQVTLGVGVAQPAQEKAASDKPTRLEVYDDAGKLSIALDGETRLITMYAPEKNSSKAIQIGLLKNGYWGYWAGHPSDKSEIAIGTLKDARAIVISDENGVARCTISDVNDIGTGLVFSGERKVRINLAATRKDEVGLELRAVDGETRTLYLGHEKKLGGVAALWNEEGTATLKLPKDAK